MLLEVRANDMMPHMNAIIEVKITNKQLLYMCTCVCLHVYRYMLLYNCNLFYACTS